MGVVITGLALGITIATVFTPNLIDLGGKVFAADEAWRMPFLVLGAATLIVGLAIAAYFRRQERGLPYVRATLHMLAFAALGLAAVMAVYFVGDAAGLSDLGIAVSRSRSRWRSSPSSSRAGTDVGAGPALPRPGADQPRVHRGAVEPVVLRLLVGLDRRRRRALVVRPLGADRRLQRRRRHPRLPGRRLAVRRRRAARDRPQAARDRLHRAQFVLTLIFGFVVAAGGANVWLMAALLFSASTFFNAMQPIAHAMLADIAAPEHHGAAFGMNNLIGEIGAVLSPAVSGALRDATGGWSAAVFVDAGADRCAAILLFLFVREARAGRLGGGARRTVPADPGPVLRRRRRQRERQRLAVGARAQRVVGADRLLELDRHRVVGDRAGVGQQRVGAAEPPTGANAPPLTRAPAASAAARTCR